MTYVLIIPAASTKSTLSETTCFLAFLRKLPYRSARMVLSQNPAPLGPVYKSDSFGSAGLSMFWL